LQSGGIIENAHLAFKTYGSLNDERTNVILYPTWYSGFISDNEWLIGYDKTLNPEKYFIIVVCLFGNGQSSSPSNNKTFSDCTLYDNVIQQHRLITEHFKINKIQLVVGWSMGAQQCFQWACLYPELVLRIAPFCGSTKTSPHNWVFLESLRSVLENGKREQDIKIFSRIYAGWGFTQEFYKQGKWYELGYSSLQDFIQNFWERFFLKRDPKNLETLIWTWQRGDISDNPKFKGDLFKALSNIESKTLILSPNNDLYFPKEDNYSAYKIIKNCEHVIIPGVWGHFSGGGINKYDTDMIDNELKKFMETE
jgi:homoserine O-acetyltransferase